jgi:hypothetical protein
MPPTLLKPTAIDAIIQSSTVELMRSYNLSVAPRERIEVVGHVPGSDAVGIIAFDGPNISGSLTLSVPLGVYNLPMRRNPTNTTHGEWTYELTNQLMGRIKNRLLQFQVRLHTHVPMVLSGVALERHKHRTVAEVLYRFGALRGDIAVVVDASLTRAVLEYSNASLLVRKDLLLFDEPMSER